MTDKENSKIQQWKEKVEIPGKNLDDWLFN